MSGVVDGFPWSRSAPSVDAPSVDVLRKTSENPPGGVRTSSRVLCGRCSADSCLLDIFARQRMTLRGRTTLLAKQLTAGGYPRSNARSDGEPCEAGSRRGLCGCARRCDPIASGGK